MPVISALVAVLSLPAQAQSNKSVTIVAGEEPEDLDQCSATSSQAAARILQQNVYESLIELRPDGTFAPRLATSWEQVNDLTWRFHIRQGVTFHDGAKLNADAVVLALNRVVGAKFRCQIKIKYFSDVKVGAEKVDEYTVDFRTETPAPIMPVYASGLVVPSPNTPFDKLQLTASGTGPYVLEKWVQQQEITAKRNPNYWDKGKKLEVEAVRYIFRKDTAVQAAMVANGEADMAGGISVLDANNPKTDVAYPNAETSYLRIDSQVPPLDDIRIRKALNYAIDRQAMMGPIFPRGSVLATQVWGPNIAGHNFEIDKKVWPYDPAKARQLIAEAKAAGVKVDTEIELQGRIDVYPNAQELMEAAYQYYKNVGLNVKLKMYEVGTWRQRGGEEARLTV